LAASLPWTGVRTARLTIAQLQLNIMAGLTPPPSLSLSLSLSLLPLVYCMDARVFSPPPFFYPPPPSSLGVLHAGLTGAAC
jgi:hypothetical protein